MICMAKVKIHITISSELLKQIEKIKKDSFGGNRSVTIEYYLHQGLKADTGRLISVAD